ncbi:ATP-binding protein [Actinomadura gamaensis]|uniref:ATP-binding protein n=1 Tax=Actinomadura gamaensis TaxID=1763541 RepID=A0ABV9U6A7_9ACTN
MTAPAEQPSTEPQPANTAPAAHSEPEPAADARADSSATAADIVGRHVAKEDKGPSQAAILVKIAKDRFTFCVSGDGRPYAVPIDGPNVALPLRGKNGLRSQLARIYNDEQNQAVFSQSAQADAMTVLEGIAQTAELNTPHLRAARTPDSIHPGDGNGVVVDLGTPDGRCVVITPAGWQRVPRSPVLFRRSGAMKPLPDPVRDGDGLARLGALLNLDEDAFHLLVAWLVAAFIPDLPHPILTFRGEQGTGKSKSAQMVIGIIDPSGAPKRTAPRDLKSWATQAFNSWALCLDNISFIPDWLSDALCRAVTGDGMVDRALYSDDDVVVLEFRRVLALTTIDAGALAGDLAERLLTLELNLIPDHARREEAELDAAYRDAHPAILASLFDLLAQVLKALPDVELTHRPRMADFARVLAATDHVTGWHTLDTYTAGARDAVADVLDGDPFAQALIALVDQAGPEGIAATAQEILDQVPTPERLPKKWPKDATRAGGQIKRLAPALRHVGIDVDDTGRGPRPKRQRIYRLTPTSERGRIPASTASTPSPEPDLTSHNTADASRLAQRPPSVHLASTASAEPRQADAVDAQADAGPPHSVRLAQSLDQRKQPSADAGDAVDAEMHYPSDVGTCAVCRQPMTLVELGQTTHPNCQPEPPIGAAHAAT